MNLFRRLSTVRLAALLLAVVVLAAGATAALAGRGGAAPPAAKPLPVALDDALRARPVAGITARIRFTNHLFPSGALPEGTASAMLTGASGRMWLRSDGRFRLELQSDSGDAQIVWDGRHARLYDASSNTVYRLALPPARHEHRRHDRHAGDGVAGVAGIERLLRQAGAQAVISGARPGTVAGRPAYTVRVSPRHDAGLLGAAEVAWDAARGVPLRVAVYAQGDRSPVLELKATDISYGPVPMSDIAVAPPKGARTVDVSLPDLRAGSHRGRNAGDTSSAAGPRAPRTLVGLPLTMSRAVTAHGHRTLVRVYGKGLGALVVLESKADGKQGGASLPLPKVSIDGATGTELATALGTVVQVHKDGMSYLVAGSLPPAAAEAAARSVVR